MTLDALLSFSILSILEIVLSIDNILFITIVTDKVENIRTRKIVVLFGVLFGLISRITALNYVLILSSTAHYIKILNHNIYIRNAIFLSGGIFLIYKSVLEIFREIRNSTVHSIKGASINPYIAILQILFIDVVFSVDSITTAIGISDNSTLISIAMIIAALSMLLSMKIARSLIERYKRAKNLSICFVLMIGIFLICDGINYPLDKKYLYSSFVVAALIEIVNIFSEKRKA